MELLIGIGACVFFFMAALVLYVCKNRKVIKFAKRIVKAHRGGG